MRSCFLQLCLDGEKKRISVAMDKVGGDASGDKVAGRSIGKREWLGRDKVGKSEKDWTERGRDAREDCIL